MTHQNNQDSEIILTVNKPSQKDPVVYQKEGLYGTLLTNTSYRILPFKKIKERYLDLKRDDPTWFTAEEINAIEIFFLHLETVIQFFGTSSVPKGEENKHHLHSRYKKTSGVDFFLLNWVNEQLQILLTSDLSARAPVFKHLQVSITPLNHRCLSSSRPPSVKENLKPKSLSDLTEQQIQALDYDFIAGLKRAQSYPGFNHLKTISDRVKLYLQICHSDRAVRMDVANKKGIALVDLMNLTSDFLILPEFKHFEKSLLRTINRHHATQDVLRVENPERIHDLAQWPISSLGYLYDMLKDDRLKAFSKISWEFDGLSASAHPIMTNYYACYIDSLMELHQKLNSPNIIKHQNIQKDWLKTQACVIFLGSGYLDENNRAATLSSAKVFENSDIALRYLMSAKINPNPNPGVIQEKESPLDAKILSVSIHLDGLAPRQISTSSGSEQAQQLISSVEKLKIQQALVEDEREVELQRLRTRVQELEAQLNMSPSDIAPMSSAVRKKKKI